MKVLLVSLFLPEIQGTSAGSRFAGEVLRQISEDHEVSLATRVEESQTGSVEDIRPYCANIYLFPYPTTVKRDYLALMRIILSYVRFSYKVDHMISSGDFDVIHVEWVEAGVMLKKRNVPMILDAHDVITKPAERYFRRSKGMGVLMHYMRFRLTSMLEKHILKKFTKVFARSEYDRTYLRSMNGRIDAEVLPHPAGLDFTGREFEREENSIMFLGSYKNHTSNVESVLYFYKTIFPLILRKIPSVKLYVVGYGPTREMRDAFGEDRNVTITGYVDDIEPYYDRAKVFVAPMLTGGGVIVKTLDAMAAGTPVVSTAIGNEGIGGIDGVHLLIADDPSDFADKVVALLSDNELWLRISHACRNFVHEGFHPGAVREVLKTTYEEIAKAK